MMKANMLSEISEEDDVSMISERVNQYNLKQHTQQRLQRHQNALQLDASPISTINIQENSSAKSKTPTEMKARST